MNNIIISQNTEIEERPSVPNLLESFLSYKQVKQVTREAYTVALKTFALWLYDNNINQPQRSDILDYVRWLDTPHARRTKADKIEAHIITYSAGTQARYLRAVKLFFKWTASENLYPNIAQDIAGKKVRTDVQKRDALPKEDAINLLESIDRSTPKGKRDYAMILLSVTAGLRIIEMQRANIGDIETLNHEHILYIQGKGHDEKDAYKKLTPEVFDAISDYLAIRSDTDPTAPLFASVGNRSREKRLTEPSISAFIKKHFIEAGYNSHRLSAHSLRHTSITCLLEAGASLQEAQKHARHSDPATTGIYAHNIDQKKSHTEQTIYNYLFGTDTAPKEKAQILLNKLTADELEKIIPILESITA